MICPKCGKTSPCDKPSCPLRARELFAKSTNFSYKKDFDGITPNVFVGHFGYPKVNLGLLSTDHSVFEKQDDIDNPLKWSKEDYDMNSIVNLRTTLVNSKFKGHIDSPVHASKSLSNPFLNLSTEISLSQKNVDTEIHLKQKPELRLSLNREATPHGPSVPIEKASIIGNIRVPTKVDRAVSDIDYKASDALHELYEHKFDEHYLTKILSVGNLGIRTQRKLVPTRWAITAVDDSLGKGMLDEVKGFSSDIGFLAYYGGYLGNYFLALFFPGEWSYEFIENFTFDMDKQNPAQNVSSESDYESFSGRKEYASETAGGYYAARLPIIEYLKKIHRQGSVMLMRFITKDYYAPLGVWVVRESVRKTMMKKPLEFGSEDLMLLYAKKLIQKKFKYDIAPLISQSKLLDYRKKQRRMGDFL